MKTSSLKKAIDKAGLKISQTDTNRYFVEGPNNYSGSFIDQGGHVICLSVCHKNETPDSSTDYFPQTYCDTIKRFLKYVTE